MGTNRLTRDGTGQRSPAFGRRSVLRWAAAVGGGVALSACGSSTDKDSPAGQEPSVPGPAGMARHPAPEPTATNPEQALARLRSGNIRFATGNAGYPDQSTARRTELAVGQHPFALVLACVDSRVPPELVFDQGLGDLFVVRTAGQVLDRAVRGSIQYGVLELKIPLLMVLGHEKCGAVKAALEAVEKQTGPLGNDIDALVTAIRPAVEAAEGGHGDDKLDDAVRHNVHNVVEVLGTDQPLAAAVSAGTLRIVGARYDLDSGGVEVL